MVLILSFFASGLTTVQASKSAMALTQSFIDSKLPVQKLAIAFYKGKSLVTPYPSPSDFSV